MNDLLTKTLQVPVSTGVTYQSTGYEYVICCFIHCESCADTDRDILSLIEQRLLKRLSPPSALTSQLNQPGLHISFISTFAVINQHICQTAHMSPWGTGV